MLPLGWIQLKRKDTGKYFCFPVGSSAILRDPHWFLSSCENVYPPMNKITVNVWRNDLTADNVRRRAIIVSDDGDVHCVCIHSVRPFSVQDVYNQCVSYDRIRKKDFGRSIVHVKCYYKNSNRCVVSITHYEPLSLLWNTTFIAHNYY